MTSEREVAVQDDQIVVTIRELHRGEKTTITGWSAVREDLGLNPHGDAVDGLELINQEPVYYEDDDPEDDDTYPRGHVEVVLGFEDEDALERTRERLSEKATERFEWGASDAGDVRDFQSQIPSPAEVSS